MQKSFILSLLISSFVVHTVSAIGAEGVIEVIAGITDGIIQKDDLHEFQKCFTDAEGLVTIVDEAVEDFEEGSLAGYSEGFMEIQQLIMALPDRVRTCTAIEGDLTKLGQWAHIFLEPSVFIKTVSKNLVWNYFSIHADIVEALADYDQQKYFDFGEKIGEALVLATKQ